MPAPQRVLPGCGHVNKTEFAVIYVRILLQVIGTPQANVAHREKPIVGALGQTRATADELVYRA
jgi:hypothetical protein